VNKLSQNEHEMAAELRRLTTHNDLRFLLAKFLKNEFDDAHFKLIIKLLRRGTYVEDTFATLVNAEWLSDPDIERAYKAGADISVWGVDHRWRIYTLLCCAEHGIKLGGEFVECGVDRGGSAMCVIEHLKAQAFMGRTFYLFDTFQGLVRDQMQPDEIALNKFGDDRYPPVLDEVKKNFARFDFVRVVPGPIPNTLDQFEGKQVAYLHIDMNVAYPERAAFEFFWPRLATGAPVVFDDYGFPARKAQKRAIDEAAAALGTKIMLLPTGQGLVWK
jgi:Macrocin-O-methyltransferase (TylF)